MTGAAAVAIARAMRCIAVWAERALAIIRELGNRADESRLVNEFALDAKPLTLGQCAAQDREERAKWAEYVKIAWAENPPKMTE